MASDLNSEDANAFTSNGSTLFSTENCAKTCKHKLAIDATSWRFETEQKVYAEDLDFHVKQGRRVVNTRCGSE